MRPTPDDQQDSSKKSQNINLTQNMEGAKELIGKTDAQRKQEANESRRAALDNMLKEIHEEAEHPRPTFP